jgi:hypothetical protein
MTWLEMLQLVRGVVFTCGSKGVESWNGNVAGETRDSSMRLSLVL